ncbi:MAG TPA: carboxypeptidase-like regulatory domain-containing protein, partial [Cyclobacteriaceae bacterium]|nr:carboxypeptidase-like regulatory domain-containing protein [Cyclobacteriaceae bacterium]
MHEKLLTRMLRVSRYASRGVFLQILLVTLSVGVATAQVTVSGKLTAQDAPDGLPGVNILEKGTTNGIVTDANGSYKIVVSSVNATLVFSSIG